MLGEIELLRGRELGSLGTGSQAVTPRSPVDVCGEDGEGRPLTAVKAGANGSPSFSFSMNGAVLIVGMCSTADIVPESGRYAAAIRVDALVVRKLRANLRDGFRKQWLQCVAGGRAEKWA
jgi:hypothetical protein